MVAKEGSENGKICPVLCGPQKRFILLQVLPKDLPGVVPAPNVLHSARLCQGGWMAKSLIWPKHQKIYCQHYYADIEEFVPLTES